MYLFWIMASWLMGTCCIEIDHHRRLLLHFLGKHRDKAFCLWFKKETEKFTQFNTENTQSLYMFTQRLKEHLNRGGSHTTFHFNRVWGKSMVLMGVRSSQVNNIYFVEVDDNRVFRKYGVHKFLRVDFDGERKIELLKNGLTLYGIKFKAIGASSSLYTSKSMYFTSEDDPEKMMSVFGQYDKSCIFNRIARESLNFTSTIATIPITNYKVVDDIYARDGKGVLSDGIGKISYSAAERVCRHCGYEKIPLAFQIRFLGFKGMVTVCPDHTMEGNDLILRRSMKKFEGNPEFNTLEIVDKVNEAGKADINRQIIILLSSLGIHDEVFLQSQHQALSISNYRDDIEFAARLKNAKSKTKFRMKDSVIARGLLDETNQLTDNQVIVFSKTGEMVPGGQRIVVFRNPGLHPRDVKIFQTVSIPNYHKNWFLNENIELHGSAIIFASNSSINNIPGDLDGDMFFVSWNREIIPDSEYFQRWKEKFNEWKNLPYNWAISGVSDFFHYLNGYFKSNIDVFDFRMDNNIGLICNKWVAVCDKEGANSDRARELACIFEANMEASKTGKRIELPKWIGDYRKPIYMEGGEGISTSIIGKLYEQAIGIENKNNSKPYHSISCFFQYLNSFLTIW